MSHTLMRAPFPCSPAQVRPEWIDGNGHMNMAYYALLFDQALDDVFDALGIGWAYTQKGQFSCFTGEVHINYLQELSVNAPVRIDFQLLDQDAKRMHYFQSLYHAQKGYLAATTEQISLHVNLETRRTAPYARETQDRLTTMMQAHQALPWPEQAGRTIGIPKKRPASS